MRDNERIFGVSSYYKLRGLEFQLLNTPPPGVGGGGVGGGIIDGGIGRMG